MLLNYVGMLFCIVVWGSNFVASSWLVQQFSPLALAAIRLSLTSVFLVISALLMHKFSVLSKKHLVYLLLSGFFGTLINQVCFFKAVTYTSPTESALIMSLTPIATCAFAYFILKEQITPRMVIGSMIAIMGVYVLIARGTGLIHPSLGDAYAFGAMLSFSFNQVIIRKLTLYLDTFIVTVYCTILGTGMFIPLAMMTTPSPSIGHTFMDWLILILSGIMSQGVCGLIWNRNMAQVGASKASILTDLQPFVAMVTGYVFLGLPITFIQLLGGCLIILGVIFSTVRFRIRKKNHTASIGI
ncbi:DMT family transporter [Fodinisporobacter ferrooxydans]|uniref:DMT family transporter n=1 Tax=Fodinisporobacter ferrooxydans TaxID=2901836 RepID=A0ABY4CHK5_9BACL|nr:DMT family transporter [Alicyclobacillaceae bacterium MYW30-H2]